MMNTEKIIELCGEIEREADYICRYTKTGAIYGDIQVILARVKDIRAAVGEKSESHHAYWIPTECGVKCSSCDTEYADSDYLYMMYQCPHCFAEMGETRKSPKTNGDKIRQMSNEELAVLLDNSQCAFCSIGICNSRCIEWHLEWLRKEMSVDERTEGTH